MFHDNDFNVSGSRTDSFAYHLHGNGAYSETGRPVRIAVKSQGFIAKDGSLRERTDIRLRP